MVQLETQSRPGRMMEEPAAEVAARDAAAAADRRPQPDEGRSTYAWGMHWRRIRRVRVVLGAAKDSELGHVAEPLS